MMNERIKNSIGVAAIVALLMFAYGAYRWTNSYAKQVEPPFSRSFSVSGDGKVVLVPDIAQFTLSVITQGGKDFGSLQKENTAKSNSIIEFIKGTGVEPQDIKTQQYHIEPRYQHYNCSKRDVCPPADIVGYSVTQSVSVKVRDFSKIGTLLAGVAERGANSVSQLSFALDDPAKAETEARSQAMEEARAKAEATAKAGGFRLGRLLSVSEGGYPYPYIYGAEKGFGGDISSMALPTPAVEPGSQEVNVQVMLTYEIK